VLQKGGDFITVESLTNPTQEHLNKLSALADQQEIKPYIDISYPLTEIVAAHEYVEKGRKRGNVVIEIAN